MLSHITNVYLMDIHNIYWISIIHILDIQMAAFFKCYGYPSKTLHNIHLNILLDPFKTKQVHQISNDVYQILNCTLEDIHQLSMFLIFLPINIYTLKPLNTGHLWLPKCCPLFGGPKLRRNYNENIQKKNVCYYEMSVKGFTVYITILVILVLLQLTQDNKIYILEKRI